MGLDAPVLGPPLGSQRKPQVAFDGSSYFVVWTNGQLGSSFGAPVTEGGTTTCTAVPLPVGDPVVASDGQAFLVAGVGSSDAVVAARVSAAGVVLGTSLIAPSTSGAKAVRVASSGDGYLVVWLESAPAGHDSLRRARVASDGTVLDPGGIQIAEGILYAPSLSFDGTRYAIAWKDAGPGPEKGRVATISPNGALLQQAALPVAPERMACDAGRCVLTWFDEGYDWRVSWMTPQGALQNPQGTQISSGLGGTFSIGFDGPDALLVWSRGDYECATDRVSFSRMTPAGTVVTPSGTLLREGASDPAVVKGNQGAFITWREGRHDICGGNADIYGAHLAPGGTQLDESGAPLSWSANSQFHPSLAFDGQRFLLAWTDDRNFDELGRSDIYAAHVSLDGDLLDPEAQLLGGDCRSQHVPRVVFDGSDTLVTWWSCDYNILESRCNASGVRFDAGGLSPLSLPFETYKFSRMPMALSGGQGAALVSPFYHGDDEQIYAAAVGPNGVDGAPAASTGSTRVASAFDGVNHLVVWIPEKQGSGPLLGARVTPDGTVLDPGGFHIAPPGSEVQSFSLAFGSGVYLVAWDDAATGVSRILAARVSPAGVVLDGTPAVVQEHPDCLAPPLPHETWAYPEVHLGASAVAFDGARFVLGWRACGPQSPDLFGALVDTGGAVLAHFPITADAHPDRPPALSGTGAGSTLIAYSSFRAQQPLGALRIYTKRLDGAALLGAMP